MQAPTRYVILLADIIIFSNENYILKSLIFFTTLHDNTYCKIDLLNLLYYHGCGIIHAGESRGCKLVQYIL